ncbi:putative AstB/chuR-related protein [Paratrimastix pyriformis]|uniref:Cytochrome b5 domain-containing protein 1 n=1 Tax=Paratrimastix pyriformis TaxID=342808 RepID=A0ABQ8UER9_9EUKA|nr:putative AstB/chuR-related protein [Paratrimastix pyriformis]
MRYFLFATTACNLHCTYCGNDPEEMEMPIRPNPEELLPKLRAFLERDREQTQEKPILVFYGGEPLTNWPFVKLVMDTFDCRFILQSNSTLLDTVPTDYLEKFESILVSIDGRRDVVDRNRGEGTYDRVVKNCTAVRQRARVKNMVARGCCMEGAAVDEEVRHLMSLQQAGADAAHPKPLFDNVYWQLNTGFDFPMRESFPIWVRDSYNPGISRLVDEWVAAMRDHGRVAGIVPFVALMKTLLEQAAEDRARPADAAPAPRPIIPIRCGIGHDTFSITTDGRLGGCPCGIGEAWNTLGYTHPKNRYLGRHPDLEEIVTPAASLPNCLTVREPCPSCDIRDVCGGRCVYASKTKYWGDEGFDAVCATVRHLVAELRRVRPEVEQLIVEVPASTQTSTYFSPNEVAQHNHPSDCWLSWLGKVYDLTPLIRDNASQSLAIQPILDNAGRDISHWFNPKTGMLRTCVDEASGMLVPFLPMGKLLHALPRDPRTDCPNDFAIPWWADTRFCIGTLTRKPRKIRLVNMLTRDEHVIEVCTEETLEQIRSRYLSHNAHAHSYTWKFLGQTLDMTKTLPENNIPDEDDDLHRLRMDPDAHIPTLHLYYNDDLTVA